MAVFVAVRDISDSAKSKKKVSCRADTQIGVLYIRLVPSSASIVRINIHEGEYQWKQSGEA